MIGDAYYCGSPELVSLSRMPPQGFVRIDLERTPARDACAAAQRRLDTTTARGAGAQADQALVQICAARRCIFWRQATAVSERDVVKTLCIDEHRARADGLMTEAIDARARLDGAESADTDRALTTIRRDATDAAALRAEAARCIGAEAMRHLEVVADVAEDHLP